MKIQLTPQNQTWDNAEKAIIIHKSTKLRTALISDLEWIDTVWNIVMRKFLTFASRLIFTIWTTTVITGG